MTSIDRLLLRPWAWKGLLALALIVRVYFLRNPVSTLAPIDPVAVGRALLAGHLPYRSFPFEYPPGALLGFVLPGLFPSVSSSVIWLQAVFVELSVLILFRGDPLVLRRCLLVTTLQFPLISGGIDALVMASLVFATALLSRGDQRGWWLAGFGVSVKLFPGILWGIGVRWGRVGLAALLVTLVVLVAPLAVADASRTHVGYQLERGVQQESVAATITWAGQRLRGDQSRIEFRYGAQELVGADRAGVAVSVLFGALLLAVAAVLRWGRREVDVWHATFVVLLVVLCTSKVLSPQFMALGAPLAARIGRRWFLAYLPLPVLTYMAFRDTSKGDVFMSVVAARNALLVGLALTAAWAVLRPASGRDVTSREPNWNPARGSARMAVLDPRPQGAPRDDHPRWHQRIRPHRP